MPHRAGESNREVSIEAQRAVEELALRLKVVGGDGDSRLCNGAGEHAIQNDLPEHFGAGGFVEKRPELSPPHDPAVDHRGRPGIDHG